MKDSTLRRSDYNYDVFISYSRKNLRFVKQVVCTLKAFGYRIWRDEEILEQYPGDPYRKHVEEGIAESALVLYIHTKASAGSAFVQEKELPYAQKRRKKIVVFRYRDTDPTGYRLPSLEKAQEIALLTPPRCTRKDPLFSIRVAIQRCFGELTPEGGYIQLETNPTCWKPEDLHTRLTGTVFTLPIPESRREALAALGFTSEAQDSDNLYGTLKRFVEESGCTADAEAFIEETACETADYIISQKREHNKTLFNGLNLGVKRVTPGRTADGKETQTLLLEFYRSNYFTFKTTSRIYQKLYRKNPELFRIETCSDLQRYIPFLCSLGIGGFNKARMPRKIEYLWVLRSKDCEAGNLYHFSYDETIAMQDIDQTGQGIDLSGALRRGMKEELGFLPHHLTGEGGIFEIGIILTGTRIELELLSYQGITRYARRHFPKILETAKDRKLEIGDTAFLSIRQYKRELADKFFTPESLALIRRMEIYEENERHGNQ